MAVPVAGWALIKICQELHHPPALWGENWSLIRGAQEQFWPPAVLLLVIILGAVEQRYGVERWAPGLAWPAAPGNNNIPHLYVALIGRSILAAANLSFTQLVSLALCDLWPAPQRCGGSSFILPRVVCFYQTGTFIYFYPHPFSCCLGLVRDEKLPQRGENFCIRRD